MKIKFSKTEKKDLFKAWAALSFAFAIVLSGGISGLLGSSADFILAFIVSGITLGLGFLCHELSHKFLAQKYGCWAEFRSFDQMLFLAILMSFFGFIFAAPGGVAIRGHMSYENHGKVSAAGILANIVVALFFMSLIFIFAGAGGAFLGMIAFYGMLINSWLAVFNLLPIGNFDGRKVLAWSKLHYGILAAAALIIMFAANRIAGL